MASLRKRPADVVVSSVEAAPITNDASSPEPPLEATKNLIEAEQALRAQLDALGKAGSFQRQQQEAISTSEDRRRDWLASNRLAQEHYNDLGALHNEALKLGLADTSPEYFQHMEGRLAALRAQHPSANTHRLIEEMQAQAARDADAREPPKRPAPSVNARYVSAPVSRESISYSAQRPTGRVVLTQIDKEFARIAGITEAEYGKQKLRLAEEKANGRYTREG